jgi:hypothetical protein
MIPPIVIFGSTWILCFLPATVLTKIHISLNLNEVKDQWMNSNTNFGWEFQIELNSLKFSDIEMGATRIPCRNWMPVTNRRLDA